VLFSMKNWRKNVIDTGSSGWEFLVIDKNGVVIIFTLYEKTENYNNKRY